MNVDVFRMDTVTEPRHAAVLGGNRIPFARSGGPYAQASNQDMLTAALDGLVARFGLQGERLGDRRRRRRAQAQPRLQPHARVRAGLLARPRNPSARRAEACDTGLQAALSVANKIALGQIEAGIAGGIDTTSDAPVALNDDLRRVLMKANVARVTGRAREAARPPAAGPDRARHPAQRRAAHRALDGRAPGAHDRARGGSAARPGRARRRQPPAPRRRLRARLLGRPGDAVPRPRAATRTCARTRSPEKLAKLKPVFGTRRRASRR